MCWNFCLDPDPEFRKFKDGSGINHFGSTTLMKGSLDLTLMWACRLQGSKDFPHRSQVTFSSEKRDKKQF